jgi:predicted flap endonuclease-1-like 5' DNA nuclease
MYKLIQIEGIGTKAANLLTHAGVENQDDLLRTCRSRRGRTKLEEQTKISHEHILQWTHQADLARIRGVSEEYAELLEKAGVRSVPVLAHRNAQHLYASLIEKNENSHLVRRIPGLHQVETWIHEAKKLPKVVCH